MKRLAIITSHPVQYYAPWFCYLNQVSNFEVRVFYLWNFGITQQVDPGFQQTIQWDVPLLEGYEYEFVPNVSQNPGTHHRNGLQNPTLYQQVKDYAPHAVLLMNYNYSSLYYFLWRWNAAKSPLLFRGDSHRLTQFHTLKEQARRTLISFLFKRFDACLYVGQANYDYFRYHGVSNSKLFFSPHAIDNQRFFNQSSTADQEAIVWKQALGIPANFLVILFVGKFEEKKRPLDLLQAFQRANLSETALLFVGAGALETEMRSQAQHPHIYFAPFQNQTAMPRTYAAGDVIVLPSYGNSETWGLAINEAMCMGRGAIVSTHVGCAQDLIRPHQNGLVFPAGDIATLADCLALACRDRTQLQQWGKASRQHIRHYSYEQTSQGLNTALLQLGVL